MYQNIIPASCPNCGAIFKSRLISVGGNVTNLTLSGNMESCPYCGSMAHTAEGVFDITDNILSVISSPQITKQMLQKFSAIVENAYNNKIDINTLINEANEINPELGNLIEKKTANGLFKSSFLLLMIFLLNSCSVDVNVSLDINKLIEQMSETPPAKIVKPRIKSKDKVLIKSADTSKKKISRNVLCPCGSGKKFKKCCGKPS